MAPYLPWMVLALLFLSAFRIGFGETLGQLRLIGASLTELLILQVALPVVLYLLAAGAGIAGSAAGAAVILMAAAPPITGAPNFAILAGRAPAPAMRLLILGTACFPASALIVFWLLPGIDGGVGAAFWLLVKVMGAVGAGFAARAALLPRPEARQIAALDGLGVLALAVIVIGLMSGIGPLIAGDRAALAGCMALAFGANFGLQALGFALARGRLDPDRATAFGIIAGNRNIALFLVALPPQSIAALLPFLACYQFPMYLTPVALKMLAGRRV